MYVCTLTDIGKRTVGCTGILLFNDAEEEKKRFAKQPRLLKERERPEHRH